MNRAEDELSLNLVRYVMDMFEEPISENRLQLEIARESGDGNLQLAMGLILLAEKKDVIRHDENGYVSVRPSSPTIVSQGSAQKWCRGMLRAAIVNEENVLIDGLPTTGKSTVSATIAGGSYPVLYLTQRHEVRAEQESRAEEAHQLPAFTHDCQTARGDFGGDEKDRVKDLYDRGVTPQRIHEVYDLPCESEERECEYRSRWESIPDDADRLIGHPVHASLPHLTLGRTVIFDEDPGSAFETKFEAAKVNSIVNAYLSQVDEIEANTKDDLRSLREDDDARASAILYIVENGFEDEDFALNHENGHSLAPLIVLTLLDGAPIEVNFERMTIDGVVGLYDKENGEVTVRRPPDLSETTAVIGLDGTPHVEMWENRLGVDFTHQKILTTQERQEYIDEILGYRIIQTTEAEKPYTSGNWVNKNKDISLLKTIQQKHDERPAIITSQSAEDQLFAEDGCLSGFSKDDDVEHYHNLKSLNRFRKRTLGCILGSPNLGDREIQRLSALDGYSGIERKNEKHEPLDFGEIGNRYLQYIREQHVVQAVFRFGRDGQGTTVYVNTSAIPDWLVTDRIEAVNDQPRSEAAKEILRILKERGNASGPEIHENMNIEDSVTQRTVTKHLRSFVKEGIVRKTGETKGTEWHDDGIPNQISEHAVNLPY